MAWKVQIKIYTKILKVLTSKIPSIQIILSSQSFYKPLIKQKIKIVLIIYRFLLNLQRKMISTLFRVQLDKIFSLAARLTTCNNNFQAFCTRSYFLFLKFTTTQRSLAKTQRSHIPSLPLRNWISLKFLSVKMPNQRVQDNSKALTCCLVFALHQAQSKQALLPPTCSLTVSKYVYPKRKYLSLNWVNSTLTQCYQSTVLEFQKKQRNMGIS